MVLAVYQQIICCSTTSYFPCRVSHSCDSYIYDASICTFSEYFSHTIHTVLNSGLRISKVLNFLFKAFFFLEKIYNTVHRGFKLRRVFTVLLYIKVENYPVFACTNG